MLSRRKFWLTVGASLLFLLVVMAWMPLVGSSRATLARALAGVSPDREILLYARGPRVILAALAGGALALAGVVFQALLRDALAEPYTLGVSSGAALGAVISICLGWRTVGSFPAVWLAAFAGAALTIGLVVSMASEGRRMSSFTLLLTGVTINAMCMAAILFLHYSAGFTQSFAIVRWLMGGIDSVEYRTLGMLAAGVLTALALAVRKSPELNLLAVGEEWAATRGVNLPRLMFSLVPAGFVSHGVGDGADRADRVPWADRAARAAPGRRRGPPLAGAGVVLRRRRFLGFVRHAGSHGDGARGDSHRRHHRDARRAVLHLAAAFAEEQLVGIVLIGGGARSGKSRFALEYAEKHSRRPAFVATGEARDDEMRARIERHQRERAAHWTTIEEPLDLTGVLAREASRFDLLLVDCLTLWLSNVLLDPARDVRAELRGLAECLAGWQGPRLVLITNEVGLGIVPENPLAREFRDLAGEMNQQAARAAGEVYWMVFGVPLAIKVAS